MQLPEYEQKYGGQGNTSHSSSPSRAVFVVLHGGLSTAIRKCHYHKRVFLHHPSEYQGPSSPCRNFILRRWLMHLSASLMFWVIGVLQGCGFNVYTQVVQMWYVLLWTDKINDQKLHCLWLIFVQRPPSTRPVGVGFNVIKSNNHVNLFICSICTDSLMKANFEGRAKIVI